MKLSPALDAELVRLVAQRTGHARVTITGTSMQPLLCAGMVVDIEPLSEMPRIGNILVFRSQQGLVAHRLVGGELLAFRAHSGIVAQRLVDAKTSGFVTCGDANPNRPELVPPHLVVGRVTAVWSSGEPDARRIDDARYARLGSASARTRALRAKIRTARAYAALLFSMLFVDALRAAPPAAFAVLMEATHAFEGRRYAAGVALLCSVPRRNLIEMARRHRASGLISRWLEEASRAGVAVPANLHTAFLHVRWTNALQAGRVLSCARDVRDKFTAANIPYILLKGGARLAAGGPGADLHFSGDLDVIVPPEKADAALAALRCAGYRSFEREHTHYASLHHREPLRSPHVDVPVEIHVALMPSMTVSQCLDYAALAPSVCLAKGPIGEVRVLDAVASAVHLAYHARDLQPWRDIVLLSRLLCTFDNTARARFDAFISAEQRDALRLASAVAAADALAFHTVVSGAAVKRYIAWAQVREELARRFAYPDIIESFVGRCSPRTKRGLASWLKCWIRALVLLPSIARIVHARRSRGGGSDGNPVTRPT